MVTSPGLLLPKVHRRVQSCPGNCTQRGLVARQQCATSRGPARTMAERQSDQESENGEQSGEECNCQIPSCELCYDDRSDSADENGEQSGRATPNHGGRPEPLPPPPPTCHYYDHSQHHYHFWQAPPMVVPHLSLPPLHHPPGHDGYDTSDSEDGGLPSQPFAWSDRGAPVFHPQHESTPAENAPPPDLPLWAWRDSACRERGDQHRTRPTRRSHARGERQSTERRRAQ